MRGQLKGSYPKDHMRARAVKRKRHRAPVLYADPVLLIHEIIHNCSRERATTGHNRPAYHRRQRLPHCVASLHSSVRKKKVCCGTFCHYGTFCRYGDKTFKSDALPARFVTAARFVTTARFVTAARFVTTWGQNVPKGPLAARFVTPWPATL